MHLKQQIYACLDNLCSQANRCAVAVSGGGDSMALLHMVAGWARKNDRQLFCVSVNHNLRIAAAEELHLVLQICTKLAITHSILSWNNWNKRGNLQAKARLARRKLISEWAHANQIDIVMLGHTCDDVAENFIMRLGRGSGVDGLSLMQQRFAINDIEFIRPLLAVKRQDLRDYLQHNELTWCEDASNEDLSFERNKIRKFLPKLAPFGLTNQRLFTTSLALSEARLALQWGVTCLVEKSLKFSNAGAILIDRHALLSVPTELVRRLLLYCLRFISHAPYPPRSNALNRLLIAINDNKIHCLSGCIISATFDSIEIVREPKVMPISSDFTQLYDGRWQITLPDFLSRLTAIFIRPLSEDGLRLCKDWRQSGYSRRVLAQTPSIWCDNQLIASPFAGIDYDCTIRLVKNYQNFLTYINVY